MLRLTKCDNFHGLKSTLRNQLKIVEKYTQQQYIVHETGYNDPKGRNRLPTWVKNLTAI